MKANNIKLKKLKSSIGELQKQFFETLGADESYHYRVKLGDIENDIYYKMKQNEINGDKSVNYI
jgi:hypothetical protein